MSMGVSSEWKERLETGGDCVVHWCCHPCALCQVRALFFSLFHLCTFAHLHQHTFLLLHICDGMLTYTFVTVCSRTHSEMMGMQEAREARRQEPPPSVSQSAMTAPVVQKIL